MIHMRFTNRSHTLTLVGVAVALLWGSTSPSYASFDTTGVYDENTSQTNAVDTSATVDNAEQVSLATFTNWVAAAFSLNKGGVIDFDTGTLTDIHTIDAVYGVKGSRTLRISNGTTRGMELDNPLIAQTPISGNGGLKKIFGSDTFGANDFYFDFDPDDVVTAVGLTMPSNLGFPAGVGNVSGRARYSDGTSSAAVTSNVASPRGSDDTFWGFRAPEKKSITRIELIISNSLFVSIDDLAFIIGPQIVPGDGNGDGHVDGLDYLLWAENFADNPADDPPGSPANGDYNNDGVVNGLDYLLWAVNFGTGPLDAIAVPEPSAVGLLLVGLMMIEFRRRAR